MPFFLYVFAAVFLCASPAWAYLDPGSGNMLVYLLFTLAGAALFFVKNLYYRLRSGLGGHATAPASKAGHGAIAIFSEGRAYWGTFKPIVEALISRGRDFAYLTLDLDDPALDIDDPLMDSRYLGQGDRAFAKAAAARADVMLATTPNIGAPGYPLPKPRQVKCLAHVWHSVATVAYYRKHSLDNYDAVLMVGPFQEASIRAMEKLRGLKAKECVPAGLPYLDALAAKVRPKDGLSSPAVILAAPSWGDKGFFTTCGTGFLVELAKKGYQIIIRPHPQSRKAEPELLDRVKAEMAPFKNVAFDFEPDGTASMAKADLLISDTSSICLDFAILYGRPVISIDIPIKDPRQYEVADSGDDWERAVRREIGSVITPGELGGLCGLVERLLGRDAKPALAAFRDRNIANFGRSGAVIADWLIQKADSLNGGK